MKRAHGQDFLPGRIVELVELRFQFLFGSALEQESNPKSDNPGRLKQVGEAITHVASVWLRSNASLHRGQQGSVGYTVGVSNLAYTQCTCVHLGRAWIQHRVDSGRRRLIPEIQNVEVAGDLEPVVISKLHAMRDVEVRLRINRAAAHITAAKEDLRRN